MMNSTVCWVVGGLILLAAVATRSNNVCSPDRRSTNLGSCLLMLKIGLTDKARFWFGSQYDSLCPGGPDSSAFCGNDRYPAQDSIGTRIFPSLDLTLIQKYVEVHYDSEQGSFSACVKNRRNFNRDAWQGEIIPTSSDVYQPWFLRHQPLITWDAVDDELYTVVFYDVGHFVTNMVVVNIPGNNMSAGEVKRAYVGPDIAYDQKNPYGFFLFRQVAVVDVSAEWTARMAGTADTPFSIRDFATAHDMTGPVGANWVVATGDEYAANIKEEEKELYTCPLFVADAGEREGLWFIPDTAYFTVFVHVTFISEHLSYTVCCDYQLHRSVVAHLNPFIRYLSYATFVVATRPTVTFQRAGYYTSSTNFTGELFTLIMVDSTPGEGRNSSIPGLHWMVVNIADGNTTTGDVVQTFRSPLSMDTYNHQYLFLLYRQVATVNVTEAHSYRKTVCPQDDLFHRCPYDVTRFADDNGLTLVGANWMNRAQDDYVRFMRLNQLGPSAENATCFGRPKYPCAKPTTTPTPTTTSATTTTTTTTTPTPMNTCPTVINSCRPVSKTDTLQLLLLCVSMLVALVNK